MNRKIRTIAAAVLLGAAPILEGCKEDVNVSPNPSDMVLSLEVGESKTMSCTFNKGKDVLWEKSNDCVIFQEVRKMDEINVRGIKEGDCRVTATGVKGTKDYCNVEVKTYIRPQEPINLYKGDSASVVIKSGYGLKYEINDSFYATINSFTRTSESYPESQYYNPNDNVVNQTMVIGGNELNKYDACVLAKHVGETSIGFYDYETEGTFVYKGILVKVNPRYTTYVEPGIDYDDTQDSVMMKVGFPSIITYSEGNLVYGYTDYSTSDQFVVMFDQDLNNDRVLGYAIQFTDEEMQQEIPLFIEERYAYWLDGYYINADDYARATLFLSFEDGIVTYFPRSINGNKDALQLNRMKQLIQNTIL